MGLWSLSVPGNDEGRPRSALRSFETKLLGAVEATVSGWRSSTSTCGSGSTRKVSRQRVPIFSVSKKPPRRWGLN